MTRVFNMFGEWPRDSICNFKSSDPDVFGMYLVIGRCSLDGRSFGDIDDRSVTSFPYLTSDKSVRSQFCNLIWFLNN